MTIHLGEGSLGLPSSGCGELQVCARLRLQVLAVDKKSVLIIVCAIFAMRTIFVLSMLVACFAIRDDTRRASTDEMQALSTMLDCGRYLNRQVSCWGVWVGRGGCRGGGGGDKNVIHIVSMPKTLFVQHTAQVCGTRKSVTSVHAFRDQNRAFRAWRFCANPEP